MEAKEAHHCAGSTQDQKATDLACSRDAILLWYLPTAALFVGAGWKEARAWLWIPAFLVMGIACLVNAARCGRLHCFVTGPVYLLAAIYVALAAARLVPLQPGMFLLVVLAISIVAILAERPLGMYRKRA